MEILQREMSFDSCAGEERIFVRILEPEDHSQVRGVLQIAHGMAEHSLLYLDFAQFMAKKGFAVFMNDHLGHGKSVSTGGAYGYFGEGGCQNMVLDMHKLSGMIRTDYPGKPLLLMGHSMGSFLSRSYAAQFGGELAAAVFLGTCGNPGRLMLNSELAFANGIVKKYGPKAHYPLFSKLSTEKFNKIFAPNRTPHDWLSRDEAEVDRYSSDPLCGFDLTVSGYRDILELQRKISAPQWYQEVPLDLPILLVAGDRDPVGDCGKGVRQVAKQLKDTGHQVKLILYPGARHVVLCETNKEEAYRDISEFLEGITPRG